METTRNNATGEISVKTKNFVSVIFEDSIKVQVGDVTAHEWKFEVPASVLAGSDHDKPSPRSRPNRRRGAR
jgi:hypothetical protein